MKILNYNMKNKKNKFLLLLLPFLVFLMSFGFVFASGTNYGLDGTVEVGDLKKAFSVNEVSDDSSSFLSTRLGTIVGAILSFIGVLFMILIVYGGLLWMTARGNEQQVEKAKNLIIQAVIGLIIVLAAYTITAFIGSQLTDVGGGTTGGTTP